MDLKKKHYGESSAAEKFQMLQQARAIAADNSIHSQNLNQKYYDLQAAPHQFHKGQYVWLKKENFLGLNAKLAPKYEGPYLITNVKGQNNVTIKIRNRDVIVNVNRLKAYHSDSKFSRLQDEEGQFDFQKQGGDRSELLKPESEKQHQSEKQEQPVKRKRGRPRKNPLPEPEPEPEPEHQESEAETEGEEEEDDWELVRPRTRLQAKNQKAEKVKPIPPPIQIPQPIPSGSGSIKSPSTQASSQAQSPSWTDEETDTATEDEEENDYRTEMLRKLVDMEQQSQGARNKLISIICQKEEEKEINLMTPLRDWLMPQLRSYIDKNWKELQRRVPGWTPNQLINYWTTGDINMNTGHYESISPALADFWGAQLESKLLNKLLPVQPAPAQQPVPVPPAPAPPDPIQDLKQDVTQPAPPAQTGTSTSTATAASTTTAAGSKKYNLLNIRGELLRADFGQASQLKNLNPDEQAYFQYRFYRAKTPPAAIIQSESRPTRQNPSGSRTFFSKKS